MRKFDVSERLACRVLGQHRSTQRKAPKGRADDAALTADIVALATEYGRYGYRRITAMLRAAGWAVNVKRVERIWRQEGLKVPGKQPKKGRLWLTDGSCVRLRPDRPNHVWSYDFVEDRTHNGRKFRMLNVIDEYTRECLAIRVDRRLKSTDVIDVLSDLFILRGVPGHVRSDDGPEFIARAVREWIAAVGARTRVHRARKPLGERLLRELQLQAPRRAAERGGVLQHRRGEDRHRELATALQYTAPALEPRLQAARAARRALAGAAAFINHGRQADHALDLNRATKWGQAKALDLARHSCRLDPDDAVGPICTGGGCI
jgi:transposase InsO family protein